MNIPMIGGSGEPHETMPRNMGDIDRVAFGVGGAALLLVGLRARSLPGMVAAGVGASFLAKAATGSSWLYSALGINTAGPIESGGASIAHKGGIKIEKAVTINASAPELYRFWRRLENLPRIMRHLESVTDNGQRSHWVAKGPAGMNVEWDAEIINEVENELIGWQSTVDSQVNNAGSVHFTPAPGGRGTEVRVVLSYAPPGGKLGAAVAKLFGEEPEMQITEDLQRFKQLMEAGEVPTTQGQPAGSRA